VQHLEEGELDAKLSEGGVGGSVLGDFFDHDRGNVECEFQGAPHDLQLVISSFSVLISS